MLWNDQFDLEKEEYARLSTVYWLWTLHDSCGRCPYFYWLTWRENVLGAPSFRFGRHLSIHQKQQQQHNFISSRIEFVFDNIDAFSSRNTTAAHYSNSTIHPLDCLSRCRRPFPSVTSRVYIMVPVLLVDEDRVAAACIDMPLKPGPSSIADTYCPAVVHQLAALHQQASSEARRQASEQPHENPKKRRGRTTGWTSSRLITNDSKSEARSLCLLRQVRLH